MNLNSSFLAPSCLALWGLLCGLLCPPARAAGGHFAVDDAAIAEPGQCQLELWQEQGGGHRLQHLGPACRVGEVELGLNLERLHNAGEPRLRSWGPQLKWATALTPELSAGLAWALTRQQQPGVRSTQSLLLPLSWQPDPRWALHLNLGRDFRGGRADLTRRGLAAEWAASERWSALAELFDDGQRAHRRLGLRWQALDCCSLDLSHARPQGSSGQGWWSLGLNWAFAR